MSLRNSSVKRCFEQLLHTHNLPRHHMASGHIAIGFGWVGIFKDVRFYPIMNFGHFGAPSSPLTFHNIKNHGGGSAEGEPRRKGSCALSFRCPQQKFRRRTLGHPDEWECGPPSSDLDIDDATLGKLLTEAQREHADYRSPEGVSVSQSSLSVVFDRTGKPVGENSSNAQIRTLLDEQRQMIIPENCEKIGHHELQAAHAEEERRILREELWRQQMDFREVHQQSLTEMEELRKFQSSTYDTLARRKLIEDQNTIMELSGRLQELQNDVNCMKDSQDFQDAESVRSGNSHVTTQPVSIPYHIRYRKGC